MRCRARRTSGFTVVEVAIACVVGTVILAGAGLLAKGASDTGRMVFRRTGLAAAATHAADSVAADLQVAGLKGEDENGNGVLDAGEDTNRNGRLDADFNLADGNSASSISFNQVQSDWTWTGPITYTLVGDSLRRTSGTKVLEVCRHVQQFSISRTGDLVTVQLTLQDVDGTGRTCKESARRTIHVRN